MEKRTIYLDGLAAPTQASLLEALADLELVPIAREPGPSAQALHPTFAVITVERDPEAAFALVYALSAAGTRVAVVAPTQDADTMLRALRAGAREFIAAKDVSRLEAAVRNLARPVPGASSGRVTAVFAPKGGVGATTLAANLAAAIAAKDERACVVDLDLQLGDVLSFLDLSGGYSISEVLANMKRLDRDLLDASVARHRSGVAVLAQSERIEEADQVEPASIGRLLSFLRQHYGHVLVDGIRSFDELGLAALDAADRILLVVTQQVPAVRNAQRCMEVFRKLGYADGKVHLVVNRFQRTSNVTTDVIAETIGLPVLATVTNDYASLQRAMNSGSTIRQEAPRSPATRDVSALADVVAGATKRKPTGVLGRLFARGEA